MKVMIISDLQFPFEHPNGLKFCVKVKERFNPDKVIQIGDLIDNHHASQFLKEVDLPSAVEEIEQTKKRINAWAKVFPNLIVLKGNHEKRLERAMKRTGLPESLLKPIPEIFDFPKTWQFKDTVTIDNVLYCHFAGINGKHTTKRTVEASKQSVVQGHLHKQAGIEYQRTYFGTNFCMTVGCMINENSPAFNYDESRLINKPVFAVGFVVNGKYPYLEVMNESKK
jgi:predicted phosphodiesterase